MKYSTEQLYVQYTVCANHFEDSQFMNPAQKNRLIHNAVPTLIAFIVYLSSSTAGKHKNFIPAVHFTFSKNIVKGPAKVEHKTWL